MPFLGFVLGFGLVCASGSLPFPFVFQCIGIAFVTVGIFTATRYLVKKYVYSTQKIGEGDYDFVVNEVNGRNSKVVCRINADEITDLIYSSDGKTPPKYRGKNGKDIMGFDYCQNIKPESAYYLYANIREGKVCV